METDSTAIPPRPSTHRSHMKRPSSSFCIPQPYPSYPDSSTTSASSPIDGIDNNEDEDDDEQIKLQPVLKRRLILRRPWTNSEQESLYVAVERLKLFGLWREVKTRMNLDRTTFEIEQEYNRLYAEIPDSEEEFYNDEDEDEDEDEVEEEEEDERMRSGEVLVDHSDDAQDASSRGGTRLSTPSLTATSSAAQSTHSSRENLAGLFGMAKAAAATAAAIQQQQRHHSNMDQQCLPPPPPPPPLDAEEEYDEGYEDYEDHHQQQRQQPQQQDQQSNCPPHHHQQQQQPQPQHHQHHQHHQHQHQRNLSTSSTTRPARMVRVWTPEQSENLKNLVEVYFPGAYRINWVWVAAQMGNAFTRKQCKNKWEIMRRRMGTEDEIMLLKKGYQEFGPSWGQIQEKYLPERSRGGISIMWDLLETREAELHQQQAGEGGGPVMPGQGQGPGPGVVGSNGLGGGGGMLASGMTIAGPGSAIRKPLSHHRRNSSMSSLKSSLRVNVSKDSTNGSSQRHQRTLTVDMGAMDLSSPTTALYTLTEEMSIGSNNSRIYTLSSTSTRPSQHRKSASVSSTTSMSRYGHGRHGSDVSLGGNEWSTERMMPMTWTEPLTRRLQDLVREHFPNQSKVNWAIISSLMGSNPAVSKDQCKRRWYLISQQQQQQQLQKQPQHQQQYGSIHGHLEYRQHHDPSEAMQA
ncbi:hypothetical protein BGW39_008800 [Mortierella sp. 14UC]|nr:hypothetical protein BGW39_008800 [Mortierella sp. 14UC]